MMMLEPGFQMDAAPAVRAGRIRPDGPQVDPRIDAAVDEALARSGLDVTETALPGWSEAMDAGSTIIDFEAAEVNRLLLAEPAARAGLCAPVLARLEKGAAQAAGQLQQARAYRESWRAALLGVLADAQLLVLPTVAIFAPPLAEAEQQPYTGYTMPVNVSGFPALALPVPSAHRLPASLQLIGPPGSEALLLATGAIIEATAGYRRRK
jgi:Asp-tRNA(Asn)/Glu-tRNA(Gln) amidotransferase A subunit family amidase